MSKQYGLILPNKGHVKSGHRLISLRRFQNKGILEDRRKAGRPRGNGRMRERRLLKRNTSDGERRSPERKSSSRSPSHK
ncbi:hypothetical protein NQ317_003064 [Molorchus minor]|uniref:Uncharacterized protein n=1 Tax=Molorchus minor TaxID=1323400 RepID=A0ABQ9ITU4_9CUCU|nr:hypothetical protein NQ317_003064 [Molorchus minor]